MIKNNQNQVEMRIWSIKPKDWDLRHKGKENSERESSKAWIIVFDVGYLNSVNKIKFKFNFRSEELCLLWIAIMLQEYRNFSQI